MRLLTSWNQRPRSSSFRSSPRRTQHGQGATRHVLEALEGRVLLSLDTPVGFRSQNEPFIAVNPRDPSDVVVSNVKGGVNQLKISTNGGSSFPTSVSSTPVANFRRGGDGVIAFDSQGRLFWA